jgi:hypothetical protein
MSIIMDLIRGRRRIASEETNKVLGDLIEPIYAVLYDFRDSGRITEFEFRAFHGITTYAPIVVSFYQVFYFSISKRYRYVFHASLFEALFFSMTISLHGFLSLMQNSERYKKASDVSREKFISDFIEVFDQKEVKDYLTKEIHLAESYLEKGIDPRDLWFNQALKIGRILSDSTVDVAKLVENNVKLRMTISIYSGEVLVNGRKLFDKTVFEDIG